MLVASYADLFFILLLFWIFVFSLNEIVYLILRLEKTKTEEYEPVDHEQYRGLVGRDGRWRTIRNKLIEESGCCSVCGKKTNLIVHHKTPFHVDPTLELEETNLVVLCENETLNCHLIFGHLGNWHKYNLDIDQDIETWNKKLDKKND
jgi:5-methylcytosine-specific restriction endonuclease McrA